MENKAAYYQAELQIAAGIRRLEKAWAILDDQRGNCERVCIDMSTCVVRAKLALSEVRRLKNDAGKS